MKFPFIFLFFANLAIAVADAPPSSPDLTSPDLWKTPNVPFSFQYGGKPSGQILAGWQASDESVGPQLHRYSYTDPVTKLKVTAEVRLFPDFPGVIDWVLKFRNDGTADTPIIENILPLDWPTPALPGPVVLHHARGSQSWPDDFMPLDDPINPGQIGHSESYGGDSSNIFSLPFFNLQTGDHGVIEAIGWTGNWKADFNFQDEKNIHLRSGMQATHLLLHPGEEIRTPRIVLMKWSGGDWQESQNGWRRLIFAHYVPQDNGKPMMGPVINGSWGADPIANKIAFVKWMHDKQIPVDLYAVDAGWFGASSGPENSGNPWWKYRGDWYPNPVFYPNGIGPLGDACKAAGVGFSLWIEPETGMPNTKTVTEHPDWYLRVAHPVTNTPGWDNPGVELANYSDPVVRRAMTDMVSGFITNFGMTWYRQDFNIPPQQYWTAHDTPDRVGMTEIGHIEGLYQMWDELLAKHPGLHIDNCASGGRRFDIETMSRSFSLWRTDFGFSDTLAEQAMTQSLAFWVPENEGFTTYSQPGTEWTHPGPYTTPEHLYLMRLGYSAGYGINPGDTGVNNAEWIAWIKQAVGEYREVQPYIFADFYPLLPYSRDDNVWTAWQWDRPEKKDGLVMLLRRPKSPYSSLTLQLRHLSPAADYEVEIRNTYDKAPVQEMKGSDLAKLEVQLPDAPSSALVFYRQK